jgi:periplasmic protein CpxP/Spy
MKRKAYVSLILALALLVLVSFIGGCRLHKAHGMSHERLKAYVMREVDGKLDDIDATDEQKTAVFASIDSIHKEIAAFHDKCKAGHEFLLEQLTSDTPDTNAIYAMVDSRIEDFRGLAHGIVDSAVQLHKIFTPEQRNQLAKMARDHMVEEE